MEIKDIPRWLFSASFFALVAFMVISLFTGVEFKLHGEEYGVSKPILNTGNDDMSFLPIGTVISNTLPPETFLNNSRKTNWTIADGSEIPTDSVYFKLVKDSKLSDKMKIRFPDCRGVFIRGINLNRDPNTGDPSGASRKMGDYQKDELIEHSHLQRYALVKGHFSSSGWEHVPFVTGNNKEGSGTSKTGFEFETRPRNIALYFYIKIN